MNIKNLQVGMTIKNYKELCLLLEETVRNGGTSKTAQLKEWERFFMYHKNGNKFVIDEIYSKPKEKLDNRGKSEGSRNNNSAEYIKNIEKLILNLLVQGKNNLGFGKVFLSKNKILQQLKMTNENYAYCKERIPKLSKFMNINQETVEEWYDTTSDMLERNLEFALDSLKSQSLILWSKEISVVDTIPVADINPESNEIIKLKHIDQYDEEVITYSYQVDDRIVLNYREGTEKEKTFILHTEREILKQLNCKNKQDIIKMGMWETFINKVNDIVLKELEIAFYYKSYKILFNEDHVYEAVEDLYEFELSDKDKLMNEKTLNIGLVDRNVHNAQNRQNKAIIEKEKVFGKLKDNDFKHKRIKRRADKNYISDNEKLNDKLINICSESIKENIKKTKIKKVEDSKELDKVLENL